MTNHDKNDILDALLVYAIAKSFPQFTNFLGFIVLLGIKIIPPGIALIFLLALLGIL